MVFLELFTTAETEQESYRKDTCRVGAVNVVKTVTDHGNIFTRRQPQGLTGSENESCFIRLVIFKFRAYYHVKILPDTEIVYGYVKVVFGL